MKTKFELTCSQILTLPSKGFETTALEVFKWQAKYCPPYAKYLELLGVRAEEINGLQDIPFLPVDVFRNETVLSGSKKIPDLIFESSGTSGSETSRHYVIDPDLYKAVARRGFELQYGALKEYCILALLPHYMERQHSSLVYMVKDFMDESGHPDNGFYLNQHADLYSKLLYLKEQSQKTILIGVSYALMDFASSYHMNFPNLILMETGGMKGRRQELSREELHMVIGPAFGVEHVHSEYGMTELLSQAYSKGGNRFVCPPWMRIYIRENHNPMRYLPDGELGGINVIDLANIHSCAFIELGDAGIRYKDSSFAVLGRLKDSPIRGCNLLLE